MKKLILPAVLLVILYIFFASLLDISSSLPEDVIIPAEVKEILSPERIDQAIIYSNFRYSWYFFDNVLGFLVFLAILMLGISGSIRDKAKDWAEKVTAYKNASLILGGGAAFFALLIIFLTATKDHPVSFGTLGVALAWGLIGVYAGKSAKFALNAFYIILFLLLLSVINFPLIYYRTFVVEHYFELSVQGFGDWFASLLKDELISYLMMIILIPFAYWGIRTRPKDWWVWVAVVSVPILIIMIVISPVYFAPMFNKFEPLKDEALRTRILAMAEEAGLSDSQIFQVDKSKETEKVSAYVTGLFGSTRIVMWDTIIEKFTHDELEFVMAHETGHYLMKHIWKFVGLFAVILFVFLFIISRTINIVIRRYGERMGFNDIADIASLPLLLLMLSLLSFVITPVFNMYGRSIEHDADEFGLELTGDGSTAASAFIKLANENLSNPSPHPFFEFWLFDHPTLSDRIAFCREYVVEEEEVEQTVETEAEEIEPMVEETEQSEDIPGPE
jgi:Zn-dependent protease with chaperone function